MNNLKELFKNSDKLSFSEKEKTHLIYEGIRNAGATIDLIICLEEYSELINVLASNLLLQFDYLHTLEEVEDVRLTSRYIIAICGIKQHELENDLTVHPYKKQDHGEIIDFIRHLSKYQQNLTKYLRRYSNSRMNLITTINHSNRTLDDIIEFYHIDRNDLEKMENLKFKRLQDKLKNGQQT